ncbi:ATP-grasp domain-containing protein [methane-oxidizing endosymbiont of Gigantopelta aegis]|uniref:ATP-grasp domain-containing protein n=1 Tax=methane-oxidizing endosymbiont of Gigantopelta aegis TaxID=2794938 RepID=UPI001FD95015|nr:ATP-grasp domain-containing protein [methane-oxidizing endosymbiont of Gigantopelta aegis]
MKILIVEFITGGGLAAEKVPESLAREGDMMLQALLAELNVLKGLECAVMLDWRYQNNVSGQTLTKIIVQESENFYRVLARTLPDYDVFWPIAPETDHALAEMVRLSAEIGVKYAASCLSAIDLCSDKLATMNVLKSVLPVPETHSLTVFTPEFPPAWVVKPIDGAGCEQTILVSDHQSYRQCLAEIDQPEAFIAQRYVAGKAISLSVLFKAGQGWLLCCNEQQIKIDDNHFVLMGCRVNSAIDHLASYHDVIDAIARRIPGLWGYVGIDLIETPDNMHVGKHQLRVLEINPRLTTSYAGIQAATGINVAEQVLQLFDGEPDMTRLRNEMVTLKLRK